jgi:hypothetical protein
MAFSGLRFRNLSVIVDKRIPIRAKEWCCIDLAREKLFNDDGTAPPPAPQATDESSEEEGKFAYFGEVRNEFYVLHSENSPN